MEQNKNIVVVIHNFDFSLLITNAINICGIFSNLMIKRFRQKMVLDQAQNKTFLLHNHSYEFEPLMQLYQQQILILCVNLNEESINLIKLSYPESIIIKYRILNEDECLQYYPNIFNTNNNITSPLQPSQPLHLYVQIPLFDDNISCILPNKLYLTGCIGARNLDKLLENGITHIINITDILENYFENEVNIQGKPIFTYLKISIPDSSNINITEYFNIAFEFIDTALAISNVSNNKVLVHCFAGKSRSASIVIGWLMKTQAMTYEDAILFVRSYRSCVEPNLGFCCQLKEYQKILANQ